MIPWPPALLRILMARTGKRPVNLWLPLFLLWLPALALILLLLPLAALFALCDRRGRRLWQGGAAAAGLLCALRGLRVDVEESDEPVHISFR